MKKKKQKVMYRYHSYDPLYLKGFFSWMVILQALLLTSVAGNPWGAKNQIVLVPTVVSSILSFTKNDGKDGKLPREEYHRSRTIPWRWHGRGGGGEGVDDTSEQVERNADSANGNGSPQEEPIHDKLLQVEEPNHEEHHDPHQLNTQSTHHSTATIPHPMTKYEERAILGRAVLTTPHRRMPAIRIAPGPRPSFTSPQNPGPIMTASPIFVTKFSLSKSLGCALRDLRVIDQFSSGRYGRYAGPAFLARRNCVIVNVGHVRAIVMRDQVLIFLPETSSNSSSNTGSSGGASATSAREERSAAITTSSKKEAFESITKTIEALVEALLMHLNSIYHSSHHLFFEDDGRDVMLSPKQTTHMGQHWGAGWYGTTTTSPLRSIPLPDMERTVKHGHRRGKGRKERNQEGDIDSESSSPIQQQYLPSASAPPFELVVIEALLGHVCSYESSKVVHLISSAREVLEAITSNFNPNSDDEKGFKKDAFLKMQAKLGELLPLKNKVDELEAKCSEVASAIAEVLKDDEDMAAMRLSEIHDGCVPDGDPMNLHVEVELLFEDYLLQMDEVLNSLRTVQSSVQNTEEVVEIELDLLRNRIMSYEMLLELSGLVRFRFST